MTVKNQIFWERSDLYRKMSVQVPLANVTCVYDHNRSFGVTNSALLPKRIPRTSSIKWTETTELDLGMEMFLDGKLKTPLKTNSLAVGTAV